VRLTILGSDGGYPRAGGACSGYLLEHDGFNLVVDLGTGALANLQKHIPVERIDAIALSHEHPDHTVDLYPLYVARRFSAQEGLGPIPVFAPPGAFDRLVRIENDPDDDAFPTHYAPSEVEPGSTFEVGPFRIETRLLPHLVPNSGMRIGVNGSVLAYTGDSGTSDDVEWVGRDADLFISEATQLDGETRWFHLSAREAARHAAAAGAGALVLSHFWPTRSREASLEQAREEFPGDLHVAQEGMTFEVGG
jgi:ribonuclease BN (tRNA processing enzyme)